MMNQGNNRKPSPLTIFNAIFLLVIIGVIIGSIYIVFGESPQSREESPETGWQSGVSDEGQAGLSGNPDDNSPIILRSDEMVTLIPPPAENLLTIQPALLEEYLFNPGIGWIYRWGENPQPGIPSSVMYSQRSDISWMHLNPEEGIYDWTAIESQLNLAISEGKQYAFRVYTMRGENYGGHQVPQWVLDKGAVLLPSGEPDYSNCIYQQEWGNFINQLVTRYDGNPNIAFIDISGYGNFNEWSWRDDQTIWDYTWEDNYENGTASRITFSTIDGQARRRLADMFIGGDFPNHICRTGSGEKIEGGYSYSGFQKTQLAMPYAGIIQSSQYVFSQRRDVGFRQDCLGRASSEDIADRFGEELGIIYTSAPIVFETCSEDEFELSSVYRLLDKIPGTLIHNVNIDWFQGRDIADLLAEREIGYRYYLSQLSHSAQVVQGGDLYLSMNWDNLGNSPSYPQMGQKFELRVLIENQLSGEGQEYIFRTNISSWLPFSNSLGENTIEQVLNLPVNLDSGNYLLAVAIHDIRTNEKIKLANYGIRPDGFYDISEFIVTD